MKSNSREAVLATAVVLVPIAYGTVVLFVIKALAENIDFDFDSMFRGACLAISFICFLVVWLSLVTNFLATAKKNDEVEQEPAAPEAPMIIVTMPPTRKPLIGRKESIALIGAGVAGVVGALLTSFIMKRRG